MIFGLGISVKSQVPSKDGYALQAKLAPLIQSERETASDRTQELQQMFYGAKSGVVRIPAGFYKISHTISVPGGLKIIGEGCEKTVLYRSSDSSRNHRGGIMKFAPPKAEDSRTVRVSGISFIGVQDPTGSDSDWDFGVWLNNAKDFRIDHCYFEGFGFAGFKVVGRSRGVVDHCAFINNFKKSIGTVGYGVVVYGSDDWPEDAQLGTVEAVFVEDCLFSGNRHAIAANAGAHYVFRHNLVQHNVVTGPVDAHGPGFGSTRGTRCIEVYENLIEEPVHKWCGIGMRGGEGVIFNNTVKGYEYPIYLFIEFDLKPEEKTHYPLKDQIQNVWIWNNMTGEGPAEPLVEKSAVEFVQKDRDFFSTQKPGYKPFDYPHPLVKADAF